MIEKLTSRQKEILALLSQGKSPNEIAELLHVSISTVRHHLSDAYNRLGVNSQTQAIALYFSDLGELTGTYEKRNLSALSPREKTVYSLYQQGLRSKEIGDMLSISAPTARVYLKRAKAKLKVNYKV